MARRETPKKSASREADKALHGASLFYPILVDCNLDRPGLGDDVAVEGAEKPDRFYDCALRRIDIPADKSDVAICEFAAGLKSKESTLLEIKASYFISLRHPTDRVFDDADTQFLLEQIAKSAAWPLFRDLFIHMGSQTGAELPLLPNIPKLRWREPQREEGEKKEEDTGSSPA